MARSDHAKESKHDIILYAAALEIDRLRAPHKTRHEMEIEDIVAFVKDRTDGPVNLTLPSLTLLTDKDIEWLCQAVKNC